jgi:hypothetical protein
MSDEQQHPEVERLQEDGLFHTDPAYRMKVEMTARWIEQTRAALAAEGFDGAFADRIINRILYGQPNGERARRQCP